MVIMYVHGHVELVLEYSRARGAGWIAVRWKVLHDHVSEHLAAAFHNFATKTALVDFLAMLIRYLLNPGHHISFVSSSVFATFCHHHALTRCFVSLLSPPVEDISSPLPE